MERLTLLRQLLNLFAQFGEGRLAQFEGLRAKVAHRRFYFAAARLLDNQPDFDVMAGLRINERPAEQTVPGQGQDPLRWTIYDAYLAARRILDDRRRPTPGDLPRRRQLR